MSFSGIGATQSANAAGAASAYKQSASDFKALAQALQSGDLSGAQQAFAALQQDSPWVSRAVAGATPSGATSDGSASPLQALGKALQSGDIAGAQQAFAAVQQARGGHHGHHHDAASGASGAAPISAASASVPTVTSGANVDTVA
jgi:hypothetical protein